MPFPKSIFLNDIITNFGNVFCIRKENELGRVRKKKVSCKREKASVSTSLYQEKFSASVTVEAVFCVPMFLLAAVCLIWLLEIRAIQTSIKCGMQQSGKKRAVQMYEMPLLIPAQLEADIVNGVGKQRLDGSLVVNGSGGIQCEKSYCVPGSGILEMKVHYQIKLPIPQFAIPALTYEEILRVKGWNGYVKQGFSEREDKTIVYITETGLVYHRDAHCTYLEPSIHMASSQELDAKRNENGEKYYPCERCMQKQGNQELVYITEYGNRYHSTLSCSGIKRNIYAVPIKEVKGKGACSKCGK